MKRLIIFMIRRRLKLKQWQRFQFKNQKNKRQYYYFEPTKLIKIECVKPEKLCESGVSLNYLLSDKCEIKKL